MNPDSPVGKWVGAAGRAWGSGLPIPSWNMEVTISSPGSLQYGGPHELMYTRLLWRLPMMFKQGWGGEGSREHSCLGSSLNLATCTQVLCLSVFSGAGTSPTLASSCGDLRGDSRWYVL
jgi:hypothetical protein